MLRLSIISPSDREWLTGFWTKAWGSGFIVVNDRVHSADLVEGIIARDGNEVVGVVTYVVRSGACEIVTIDSLKQQHGVGSVLLKAVASEALNRGCARLFLVTTNDNLRALEFYQKRGFHLATLRPGAVDRSRRIKPEIPLVGENGIPIRDEIELEYDLNQLGKYPEDVIR